MPKTRTDTPREEKVDALVAAAEALFVEQGFAGASTARLASAAGVSERTLFWYFPSKDHLLVAVLAQVTERLGRDLRAEGWPSGAAADDLFVVLRGLRRIRHLLSAFHQRAEVAEVVAEARARFRRSNDLAVGAALRELGVPDAHVADSVAIVLSFADGVLLRNIGDEELERLCHRLVAQVAAGAGSPTGDPVHRRARTG